MNIDDLNPQDQDRNNEQEPLEPKIPSDFDTPKRSTGLSVLCILTFIGSGISLFAYSMMVLFFEQMQAPENFEMFDEKAVEMIFELFKPGRLFYVLLSIGFVGSLVGASFLWNLKKEGIHVYAISQCYLILLPLAFGIMQGVPYLSIFWSGLFVYLYWMFYKQSISSTISKNNLFN